jgi:hypothetical protein
MSADPNDIQAQLDALNVKRQRLAAVAQQLGQGQQQQVVNGRIMPQGFAPLVQAIGSIVAAKRGQSADLDAVSLNRQLTQAKTLKQQQALTALLGGPPQDQQPPQALASGMSQDPAKPSIVDAIMGPSKMSTMGAPPNAPAADPQANYRATLTAASNPALAGINPAVIQAAIANAKPPADYELSPGQTRFSGGSNTPVASIAPKAPGYEHTADGLLFKDGKYLDPDGNPMTAAQVRQWKIDLAGDRSKAVADAKPNSRFGTPEGDLLGALAERGISLPAGLRSKEQQIATLNGLYARNPGKTADEIAEKIANGQINFGAEKKETTTAAALAGRTSVGENELQDFIPKALAANAKLPRGSFVPFNKLVQMGEENISDPNLKELYGRTQAILNAYDVVAARGGTDQEKRAHNRKMLETADSQETYETAAKVIADEAKIAKKAARKSELPFSQRDNEDAPMANAKGWKLHQDAQGNKAYVSPDGTQFEAVP